MKWTMQFIPQLLNNQCTEIEYYAIDAYSMEVIDSSSACGKITLLNNLIRSSVDVWIQSPVDADIHEVKVGVQFNSDTDFGIQKFGSQRPI